ncbi:MAG: hypothetical protein V3S85_03075 [Nitrospirales bacterium]
MCTSILTTKTPILTAARPTLHHETLKRVYFWTFAGNQEDIPRHLERHGLTDLTLHLTSSGDFG